ncbi:MAG: hypothetical protein K940chlam8_01230 [Chlamydiae bacterium]|nr:hypothetical protein [Chlamydiota bacterium]
MASPVRSKEISSFIGSPKSFKKKFSLEVATGSEFSLAERIRKIERRLDVVCRILLPPTKPGRELLSSIVK